MRPEMRICTGTFALRVLSWRVAPWNINREREVPRAANTWADKKRAKPRRSGVREAKVSDVTW